MADHLKGGWISYEYLGVGATANTSQYRIHVNQYLLCSSTPGQIDSVIYMGIFNADNNIITNRIQLNLVSTDIENKVSFSSCVDPIPTVCYRIDKYQTTVTLNNNTNGYIIAVQRCCRIAGIINVTNSATVGITYTNHIPGVLNQQDYYNNNSPIFAQKDTAVICYNSPFTFDFSATDIDGDSLVYSFTDGITGGGQEQSQIKPNPPSNPPYTSIPYSGSYSGSLPMGNNVTIDASTGIISGRAPSQTGDYVVAVVANEYRNGVLIGSTRKEIHITVTNCSVSAAALEAEYFSCNSFTNTFLNESTNSNIVSYQWDFGIPGITTDTSSEASPSYTYSDTGTYTIKLIVVAGDDCIDSATAILKVYPGFTPDFTVNGSCVQNPYQFTDATYTRYGYVNSWSWNFGDITTTADTSHLQNPTYLYPDTTTTTVELIVSNSKGCIDTIAKRLIVIDKPLLSVPFKDTLICSIDTLQLSATGTGSFSWTPTTYMLNSASSNPLVFPKDTTVYVVTLNNYGCHSTDTITVNVLDYITVTLPPDTTICKTDSIVLNPVSYALQYAWSPATGLSSSTVKNPAASPAEDITYQVTANLGKCQDKASIHVKVVPYPQVIATGDTTICFAAVTPLSAATTASKYQWSPANSLLNANTLHPTAGPQSTTTYYITVSDTLGCPKSTVDSVIVNVIPRVIAHAGNDTAVVSGQPLQLQASGGEYYTWSPTTGLSSASIADPIATLYSTIDSITYTVKVSTAEGCYATDNITVKIYKTRPEIFVPSGFTPNADGLNDVFKPILAGMRKLVYFNVYNRLGQLLYSTRQEGEGWDGTFKGEPQAPGTYVYSAQAIDYENVTVNRKGTVVLIR
ncbi:cell surface protein [Filimonas lacunae]|nr:cell surface protein [Filimonas lacunae]